MSLVLIGLIGYVLMQFAIGVWVSRRIATAQDYILAGRSLGVGLVAFSVFATWFGAEAIVATSAEVYQYGLAGALIDPLSYGMALVLVGLVFSARLWSRGLTTFADLFRDRYSPFVERLVVVVLLPGSLFWAAAQVRAFGQVLASTGDMSLASAITLAAFLVAAYAVVGGLLADAVTDFLQGLVLIVGLIVLAIAISMASGGVDVALSRVAPGNLDFLAPKSDGETLLEKLEGVVIALGGSMVAVELISRFLGARSAEVARNGTIIGGVMYLSLGTIPVFLGLTAAVLAQEDAVLRERIGNAEQLLAVLAAHYLPQWYFVVFAGAIVSAILSVVHAALHAPAAQVSNNIIVKAWPALGQRARLWAARLTVMGLSVVACALALSSDRIKELVEIASAFGSAGVLVTALFAVFTPIGGPVAASASILTGMLVWAAGRFALDWSVPYMTALMASLAAYVAFAAWEGRLRG